MSEKTPGATNSISSSCEWVREQASAFALGALVREDSDRVADHRLLCPECDSAFERLGHSTSLLGLAVDQYTPGAHVKNRLLTRVAEESRRTEATVQNAPMQTPVRAGRPSRERWRHPLVSFVPLLVLLFGLGGWSINAQRQLATRSEASFATRTFQRSDDGTPEFTAGRSACVRV